LFLAERTQSAQRPAFDAALATIDRFLSSARGQLNTTLKEIGVRREFADRARKAFDERLKLTVEVPKLKQIGPN
jgi:hypothetical protein